MAWFAGNLSCCFPVSAASYHAEDARLPHATLHYSPHLFPCSMTKLMCDNKSASQISVLIWGGGVFPLDMRLFAKAVLATTACTVAVDAKRMWKNKEGQQVIS